MIYEFEIPGKIIGKGRPRLNSYTGQVYTPTRTKDYENLVIQYFMLKYPRFTPFEGRVSVEITANFEVPKSAKKPEKEGNGEEGQNEENNEPKKELSMAEQLATIKLKKVGTVKAKEVEQKPKVVNHNDLLKQQILLRFKNLRLHEEENDEEEENEDD